MLNFLHSQLLLFFCTRPSLGLLPVLGPLGSGTDATHQPSPALRLLGFIVHFIDVHMPLKKRLNIHIHTLQLRNVVDSTVSLEVKATFECTFIIDGPL